MAVDLDELQRRALVGEPDPYLVSYDQGHDPFSMVPAPPPEPMAPPAVRPQVAPLPPARKVLAAATAPGPAPSEAPQGSSSMPWWAVGLRALPNALTNVYAATRKGSPAMLEGVNQRNNQNSAMFDQAFDERSRRQDAEAAQYRQDLANAAAGQRQVAQDAESARRFNLTNDRLERGLNAQRDAAQAATVRDVVRGQKQDSMDALRAKDLNSRIAVRESREARRLKGKGPGGAAGTSGGMTQADAYKALDDTYGGADKVPATARRQVDLALKLPVKDRNKALISILGQNTTGARTGKGSESRYDLQEMKAYMALSEPSRRSRNSVLEVKDSLKGMGIDVGKFDPAQGIERVPGYGRLEQHLLSMFEDEKGQEARRLVRNMAADLVKEKSGLVTTDKEREFLLSVVGAGDSMSAAQLLQGVQLMDRISNRNLESAGKAYPHAAKAYNSPDAAEAPPEDVAEVDDLLGGP